MLSDLQEENTVNVDDSSTMHDQAMNPTNTNTLVHTTISDNQNAN